MPEPESPEEAMACPRCGAADSLVLEVDAVKVYPARRVVRRPHPFKDHEVNWLLAAPADGAGELDSFTLTCQGCYAELHLDELGCEFWDVEPEAGRS